MTGATWVGVTLLGGAGAIMRFVLDGGVAALTGRTFPFGTLVINVGGSLALGALVGAAVEGDAYALAGGAALGSFTTFSTWMYETQRLVEDDSLPGASINIFLSLALGLGAAALGRLIGGAL